ncbi:hypothetical protein PCASD_25940 [Puccinia coronata f. sp. avenae]|uniref:Distal membrane-arm assembly complex protein 1-like domain-containing protein n=1 Tax=Puccinia coronata f. sp. avenae TaxID=200324 RepID=A0A2N5RV37_9BASI|nr:hypothetical protein PCASD_25940 [Puccinia coronata f. sp. avenae]
MSADQIIDAIQDPPAQPAQKLDCLGCKITGASTCILAGGYILLQNSKPPPTSSTPTSTSTPTTIATTTRPTISQHYKPFINLTRHSHSSRLVQFIGYTFIGMGIARALS